MSLGNLPPPPSQKSVSVEPLSVAYDSRGEGVGKPIIFVAASRGGLARARDVSNDQLLTLEPALPEWIKRETTSLMTGGRARPSSPKCGEPWRRLP